MKPDFKYNEVPNGYALCFNEKCVRSEKCLRRQAALVATGESRYITIVNPLYLAENENYSCFRSSEQVRFCRGITHLLDNIPYTLAVDIKNKLYTYFGRSKYYRICKKERLIEPTEQKYIRQLLQGKGITAEPVYDECIDKYDW